MPTGSIVQPENVARDAFKGPIYFTRTTNGGDSFEPARKIYETGANKQTLGNQIVVEPASRSGSLFNFFADLTNASNRRGGIGQDQERLAGGDDEAGAEGEGQHQEHDQRERPGPPPIARVQPPQGGRQDEDQC